MAVQQLEKKMSSLRCWLAHIEMELSRPIVYDTCDEKEIEMKLNQQQVNGTAHKAVRGSTYLCSFMHIQLYKHLQTQSSRCILCASLFMLIITQQYDSAVGKKSDTGLQEEISVSF